MENKKRRALISVTEKDGLEPLARKLVELGWEIVSTGGTATKLKEAGIPCIQVAEVTGYPEMMNGRVRTLHPAIFAGIIADRNIPEHMQEAAKFNVVMIDMVVVNLYNFAQRPCINEIDVGGPSMLRAAAKNHEHVIVLADPADYRDMMLELERDGDINQAKRQLLAEKVFVITAKYDTDIRRHFQKVREAGEKIALGKHGG